jgi:hypothetical protein
MKVNLVNVDQLWEEKLPVAREYRLSKVDEVLQSRDHAAVSEEVADVVHLVGIVPDEENKLCFIIWENIGVGRV